MKIKRRISMRAYSSRVGSYSRALEFTLTIKTDNRTKVYESANLSEKDRANLVAAINSLQIEPYLFLNGWDADQYV